MIHFKEERNVLHNPEKKTGSKTSQPKSSKILGQIDRDFIFFTPFHFIFETFTIFSPIIN
jgi:hypothetical protein